MSHVWRGKKHLWGELAVWLALAAAAYALSFEFDRPIGSYAFGATAWPRAIIALIAAVAVVQFVLRLLGAMRRVQGAAGPSLWRQFVSSGSRANVTLALTFGLPVCYVLLLPRTGFYLTTPAFLLAYLYLLGERRWRYLLGVPLAIYALMVLVFTTIFYVALPVGHWPVFYDINNWLLQVYR